METSNLKKTLKRNNVLTTKNTEVKGFSEKKLSAFGKGMRKYAGTVQIIDMRAVMK
ncbi:MAG: hypothetical protein Q7U47_10630 [Paludibacter sp.]|nr:hypothetical protein [Paludibacter sp.]